MHEFKNLIAINYIDHFRILIFKYLISLLRSAKKPYHVYEFCRDFVNPIIDNGLLFPYGALYGVIPFSIVASHI